MLSYDASTISLEKIMPSLKKLPKRLKHTKNSKSIVLKLPSIEGAGIESVLKKNFTFRESIDLT